MPDTGSQAFEEFLPVLHLELKRLAEGMMRRESASHTLQPTALVNEAYVRLGKDSPEGFRDKGHFIGAAAEAMRRILVDHARRKRALKRGAGKRAVTFHDLSVDCRHSDLDVLALDEALGRLQELHPDLAELCKLRYFADCTVAETAELLGSSPATVKRQWTYARAWLYERIQGRADDARDAGPGRDPGDTRGADDARGAGDARRPPGSDAAP